MKKYQVKDYGLKILSAEVPRCQIGQTIVTFVGLFGSKKEDIKIRDCENNAEMTLQEFAERK